jgi:6-pyruvoyltetrahydropterin/6-carboxytetrahydropterin synthase
MVLNNFDDFILEDHNLIYNFYKQYEAISRKAHFNSAHRLYRKLDIREKRCCFLKCNNELSRSQYELIVGVTGHIDPETGYVMDVKILSDLIKEEVENRFDHKNLNLDVPEFQDLNPTAENIVVVIWNKLRKKRFKQILI